MLTPEEAGREAQSLQSALSQLRARAVLAEEAAVSGVAVH